MSLNQTLKSLDEYYNKIPNDILLDKNGFIYSMPFNYNYFSYNPNNSLFRYIKNINSYRMDIINPKVYINTGTKFPKNDSEYGSAFVKDDDLKRGLAFIIPGYQIKKNTLILKYSAATVNEKIGHFIVFGKKNREEFKKDFLNTLGCDNSLKIAEDKCKHWCQVNDVKNYCYHEQIDYN